MKKRDQAENRLDDAAPAVIGGPASVEARLRASEERFRSFFDLAPIGKSITRPDGRLSRVNPAFCEMLGRSQEELSGLSLAAVTHPEDLAKSRGIMDSLLAGERDVQTFEKRFLHRDGHIVWTQVTTRLLRDEQHQPLHFLTHIIDVTERKRLFVQVAESDRLASMGLLAAGVAHEVNNPLTFILYHLDSLSGAWPSYSRSLKACLDFVTERTTEAERERLAGDDGRFLDPAMIDDIGSRLEDALLGAQRVREIVRGIGSLSRTDQGHSGPVDLREVVESAINLVHTEIKYRSNLVRDFGHTAAVSANFGKLSQVFINLLVNAAHAIEEGDVADNEIRVRTWQEGDEVLAEVRDTGRGIRAEDMQRIFEPFFTTKGRDLGTGLGLPISRNIIEEHGGSLEVQSEFGRGARFLVRLPARARSTRLDGDDAGPGVEGDSSRTEAGRILVIDDEPAIRSTLKRMLRDHDVILAESGEDARHLLDRDQGFDLILCDLMMPSSSGVDLHAWLVEHHPPLASRLVFMTGGVFTARIKAYLERFDCLVIDKPFDIPAVRSMVCARIRAERARTNRRQAS